MAHVLPNGLPIPVTPPPPTRSRRARMVIACLAAVIALVPITITLGEFWSTSGSVISFAQRERMGVQYLIPLSRVLSLTVDAESDAVNGLRWNLPQGSQSTIPGQATTLSGGIAAVDAVDAQIGDELGAHQRWIEVRSRLLALQNNSLTGVGAYTDYSTTVDLVSALITKITDSSNLILDPQLDSYYLLDAAAVRLPRIIVNAGRVADLAALVDQAAGRLDEIAPQERVYQDRVRTDVAQMSDGLQKAMASTDSSTVGPHLLVPLDRLQSALASIAPQEALAAPRVAALPSAAALEASRETVRATVLQFQAAALPELDNLIVSRLDSENLRRYLVFGSFLLAVLAGLALLWWIRRTSVQPPAPTVTTGPIPTGPPMAAPSSPFRPGLLSPPAELPVPAGAGRQAPRRMRS